MQRSRFVFLAMTTDAATRASRRVGGDGEAEQVLWTLVSPNNRQLGHGGTAHRTYLGCRDAVLRLREGIERLESLVTADDGNGQWSWRLGLNDETVAVSSRSYLRTRECHYNLERFLEAVPVAEIVDGTRAVQRGGGAGGRPSVGTVIRRERRSEDFGVRPRACT